MLTIALSMTGGAIVGVIFMALAVSGRIRELERAARNNKDNGYDLALLRARVRAIQVYARAVGPTENQYIVQGPDGKFSKIQLPEV